MYMAHMPGLTPTHAKIRVANAMDANIMPPDRFDVYILDYNIEYNGHIMIESMCGVCLRAVSSI